MAKRPDQSLDVLGESLLSQQADRRKRAEDRRRRDQRRLMIMGTLVAGQSLVNSALKRRAKEIADQGQMSKLKSKTQAENIAFYAPIFQSMEGQDTYEDWSKSMSDNPAKYRALQGHLDPIVTAYAKQIVSPEVAADPVRFEREYKTLKNDVTNFLVERAYGKSDKGESFVDLFNAGANEFAARSDINPSDKEALNNFLTGTTQNSLDAYKANQINRRMNNFSTSLFSKDFFDTALNTATFGFIKNNKNESNPFNKVSSQQELIPQEFKTVFDQFNVTQIIKDRFASQAAILRDEKEAFLNTERGYESIEKRWEQWLGRVQDGTFFDVHRFGISPEKEGGHRYLKMRAGVADAFVDYIDSDSNAAIKREFLEETGTLARLIGDPQRPYMKKAIMDQFIELPWVKELNDGKGIQEGSKEYNQILGSLNTQIGREEFALDFVTSLSFNHTQGRGFGFFDDFEADFSEIRAITAQKFKIVQSEEGYDGNVFGKKGTLKFETTEAYESLDRSAKQIHYESYLTAILNNQTRANLTPDKLRSVAEQFIQDVPPPDGSSGEELLNRLIEPILESEQDTLPQVIQGGYREIPVVPVVPEKKKLTEIKIPELHPSIKKDNLVPIMDYHLNMLVNGEPRLRGDKDKNKAIMVNQFLPALFDTESKFKYNAKNSKSSAYGGGQIIRTSLIPALNRLNKAGVKPKEEQMIRENMSRIDSLLKEERNKLVAQGITDEDKIKDKLDELGRIEYFKFMDKANLSESLQQQLVLADLLEKTMRNEEGVAQTGVGDTLWNALFEAPTPEAQYRAALEIFYRGHHTDPDEATIKVAERRFRRYFLN